MPLRCVSVFCFALTFFITPLNRSRYSQLEKASLDPFASSSYHLISPLAFPAKILEFMKNRFYFCFFIYPFSLTPWNLAFDLLLLKTFMKCLLWAFQWHWLWLITVAFLNCAIPSTFMTPWCCLFPWKKGLGYPHLGYLLFPIVPKFSVQNSVISVSPSCLFCAVLIYWIHPVPDQDPPFGAHT